ncbi:MAG: hypothetical protein LBS02_18370 [Hungatella sp.]|nr:hypothetical protein [Hungatella sp.]
MNHCGVHRQIRCLLSTVSPADSGSYVNAVHAMLIHGYDNNFVRKVKTVKVDAVRISSAFAAGSSPLTYFKFGNI